MKKWYLIYCKRGDQKRAKLHLENQGVDCFYPEILTEKILRGKKQLVQEPLFPSYVFIHFDYQQGPAFTTIRSTRGVVDFIRFGLNPKEIDDELITQLKACDYVAQHSAESAVPEKGQSIRIQNGPFAGIEAIYQEPDGETRSIMLVNMINQPVSMVVENKDLELK